MSTKKSPSALLNDWRLFDAILLHNSLLFYKQIRHVMVFWCRSRLWMIRHIDSLEGHPRRKPRRMKSRESFGVFGWILLVSLGWLVGLHEFWKTWLQFGSHVLWQWLPFWFHLESKRMCIIITFCLPQNRLTSTMWPDLFIPTNMRPQNVNTAPNYVSNLSWHPW